MRTTFNNNILDAISGKEKETELVSKKDEISSENKKRETFSELADTIKEIKAEYIKRHTPYVRESKKIMPNDLCPCGSGKKYKHCCKK